jgi:Polyketide cyclase / dehydrase and lipid transport
VWRVITDLARWPDWGPSVRGATLDGERFEAGATGTVTTSFGVTLPYEVTDFVDGERWAWKVARVPATGHWVEAIDDDRCRAGFDVAVMAAPYLAVCALALRRIEAIAVDDANRHETVRPDDTGAPDGTGVVEVGR